NTTHTSTKHCWSRRRGREGEEVAPMYWVAPPPCRRLTEEGEERRASLSRRH
ncbi:hypothetical protein HN51_062406, partial [Arachis hypogaea]